MKRIILKITTILCVFPKTTSTENCLSYDFLQKSFDILPLHFQIITNNGEIWQPLFEQKYKYYIYVKHYLWHDIIHLCQWIFLYDNDFSSCQCCVLFYCLLYNLGKKSPLLKNTKYPYIINCEKIVVLIYQYMAILIMSNFLQKVLTCTILKF